MHTGSLCFYGFSAGISSGLYPLRRLRASSLSKH